MKVKRFIASDMKTAMAQVRSSLGAEAVILSNRLIGEGVEILASNDYDMDLQETPQPTQPRRSYRTYADIPEEKTLRQTLLDDENGPGEFIGDDQVDIRHAIFDKRQQPDERVGQSFKSKKKTSSSAVDYRQFIVDEEEPVKSASHKKVKAQADRVADRSAETSAETELLKQELKALRSLMEAQMSMMQWDGQKKQHPVKTGLLKRLSELGLTVDISKQVLDKVKNFSNAQEASKEAINALIRMIPVASDDILNRQGVVALVGPTGVGKTTTIAKLAARFVMANNARQIALVTLDNYRIGAQEQLFTYAKILGVSVHNAKDSNELHKVLQNLYDKKLVLIDTAGMSPKDIRICEQFNTLKQGTDEVRSYVVMAANAQTSALDETVTAFKQADIAGCILTKLDETGSLGGAISMLIRHGIPVTYLSDGQAVPEDLKAAYARELVASALEMLKKHPEQVYETDLAVAFNEGLIHAH